MRELERQQKEQELNADRVFDMHTASGIDPLSRSRLGIGNLAINSPVTALTRGSSMSSRRSSEDSLEEEGRSLRDIRHELKVSVCVTFSFLILKIKTKQFYCRMSKKDSARQ